MRGHREMHTVPRLFRPLQNLQQEVLLKNPSVNERRGYKLSDRRWHHNAQNLPECESIEYRPVEPMHRITVRGREFCFDPEIRYRCQPFTGIQEWYTFAYPGNNALILQQIL